MLRTPSSSAPDTASSSDAVLVLDHLWLADAIARRFRGRGEDDEDLRQVARCGLVEAAGRYDPARGAFPAFAGPTISGVVKRHFRDHGWSVRPGRSTQQLALQITRRWSEVAQSGGAEPTDQDLAGSLGASVTDIREARVATAGYRSVSIDATPSIAASASTEDPAFERAEARMLVDQAWPLLDEAERRLLRLRFWENRSQSDISIVLGTSQMQVSRLIAKTLLHIRQLLDIGPGSHAA